MDEMAGCVFSDITQGMESGELDPKILIEISVAVAKVASDTGVARTPIKDLQNYQFYLNS